MQSGLRTRRPAFLRPSKACCGGGAQLAIVSGDEMVGEGHPHVDVDFGEACLLETSLHERDGGLDFSVSDI